MREILFRGKHKYVWILGCLLYDEENNKALIAEHFEDGAAFLREVIPETVWLWNMPTQDTSNITPFAKWYITRL